MALGLRGSIIFGVPPPNFVPASWFGIFFKIAAIEKEFLPIRTDVVSSPLYSTTSTLHFVVRAFTRE